MKKHKNTPKIDTNVGDFIKFKRKNTIDDIKKNEEILKLNTKKYSIYFGKILDLSRSGYIGVRLDSNDKRLDYPLGLTIYIERRQVLQVYPTKIAEHLTPRISLKHLWKNLVFREVKTTKYSNLLYVEYRYINKIGFERAKRFNNIEEAYNNISSEYHKNIIPCYTDYFGFTTEKSIRNNDNYYDREIFFSKKCYSELNWSSNPTGDFIIDERGFNDEPPHSGQLICGIVENGEKGLFFRKWFVCSMQFLTLWTMVCEPSDLSLTETLNFNMFKTINDWNKIEKKRKVKEFNKLLDELDTSCYSVNLKLEVNERREKYLSYNLERAALYYPNRYKQVAEVLFSKGFLSKSENNENNENIENRISYSDDFSTEYTTFQKKLIQNILWSKKIVI